MLMDGFRKHSRSPKIVCGLSTSHPSACQISLPPCHLSHLSSSTPPLSSPVLVECVGGGEAAMDHSTAAKNARRKKVRCCSPTAVHAGSAVLCSVFCLCSVNRSRCVGPAVLCSLFCESIVVCWPGCSVNRSRCCVMVTVWALWVGIVVGRSRPRSAQSGRTGGTAPRRSSQSSSSCG